MNERIYNIIISIFCIGIIFFIFMTQCKLSKIQLKMKDASLILIFFALLAYINGYEILFVLLLLSFTLIYFTPQKNFDKYFSLFIKKESKYKSEESNEESNELKENTIDTVETDIEIDDNITIDDQNDDQNDNQNDDQNDNQNDNQNNDQKTN